MSVARKLAFAYARQHPGRTALTALAMTASACVVVWVVSGFDALSGGFDDAAASYLGRYQVLASAASQTEPIPADVVAALAKDPAVAAVDPLAVGRAQVTSTKPPPEPAPDAPPASRGRGPGGPSLVGTSAAEPPHRLEEGRWIDPKFPGRREAVLSRSAATQLNLGVGDEVKLLTRGPDGEETSLLKLVGIIEQPPQLASRTKGGAPGGPPIGPPAAALYVPAGTVEDLTGRPGRVGFVNIALKDGADPAAFQAAWADRLAGGTPPVNLYTFADVKGKFETGFEPQAARRQAFFVTGVSLLAAVFIIFTTLSMGVSERSRQFAVLRAVGLTRGQIAGLIAVEGLGLAVLGWLGGLLAGWGLLRATAAANPEAFKNGAVPLGFWCVVLTGVSSVAGALLASVVPAWRAMRTSPLDAMAPGTPAATGGRTLGLAVAGLLLVAVTPLLIVAPPLPDPARYWAVALVGGPALVAGFVLLAPAVIAATEWLFAAPLALLFRVDRKLFATQLSGNLWRTVGVTVSLTVGLGLYVMTQVFGYSMLNQFFPASWAPDRTVGITGGVPDSELEAVRAAAGASPENFLPLAVDQPKLAQDILNSKVRDSSTMQDNVTLVGVDPDKALGGDAPFLRLRFVQGSAGEAAAKMKEGRFCVVPDHFAEGANLKIGDSFEMLPPPPPGPPGRSAAADRKPVAYTVAGVVALPGWHWMTKGTGLRVNGGRSGALVLAPMADVRRDFRVDRVNFFWLNGDKSADVRPMEDALRPVAERAAASAPPRRGGRGMAGTDDPPAGPGGAPRGPVRVTATAGIRDSLDTRGGGMIWAMGELPLVTLAVSALGVLNTIMASVRARRWEMGVLRAVGVTRSGLVRLVLAEAMLVGLAACLLSLAFGLVAGWCGLALVEYSRYAWWGGGLVFSLVVPWGQLAIGFAAALGVCLAAGVWPAVRAGRAEPLRLLQAGRTAV